MLIFLVIPLLDMLLVLIVIDRIGAVYDVLAFYRSDGLRPHKVFVVVVNR